MNTLLAIALSLISVFLILLVLVQRGRGGGLTGALGGMGGQSAFGTKAGDTFTRVTIVAAAVWILMSIWAVWDAKRSSDGPLGNPEDLAPAAARSTTPSAEIEPGGLVPPATDLPSVPAADDGDAADSNSPPIP